MIGAALAIADVLKADAPLMAIATGGVWDRSLARDGWRTTPEAYDPDPPFLLLPSIVVSDSGDVDDPLGALAARTGLVQVWMHAMNTVPGRAAINALASRLYELFTDAEADGIGLGGAEITIADRLGITDDPGEEQQILDYIRLQVSGLQGVMS